MRNRKNALWRVAIHIFWHDSHLLHHLMWVAPVFSYLVNRRSHKNDNTRNTLMMSLNLGEFCFVPKWFTWLVFRFTSIRLILSDQNVGVTFSQLVTDLNWACQLPSLQAFRWLTLFKIELKHFHTGGEDRHNGIIPKKRMNKKEASVLCMEERLRNGSNTVSGRH